MFAFAVYNSKANSITLVRDAFGIKPLFYCLNDNKLYFSSEINSLINLLPSAPNLNYQQAYNYLVWGKYDNDEQTFYKNIYHLKPSHSLTIKLKDYLGDKNSILPERWWWPSIKEQDISFNDAAKKIREIFLKNVRLQLRSDVSIGAALSGGIDSSAIVCAIRYLEPEIPIHTFSYISNDESISEEKWVNIINNYVDAIPHKIKASSDDLFQNLDDLIKTQGEPFASTSIYAQYKVFESVRDADITVILDGQGADELFAGYSGYPIERIRSFIDNKKYIKAIKFIIDWSKWPIRSKKQMVLECISLLIPDNFITFSRKIIGDNPKPNWIDVNYLKAFKINFTYPNFPFKVSDSFGRRLSNKLRDTINGNGLSSLLRHEDRNSMKFSIESRVPFLTLEMAEFALSLPESYLMSDKGKTKHVFREAMRGIVPDEVLDRKDKMGFGTPELKWLKQNKTKMLKVLKALHQPKILNNKKSLLLIEEITAGKISFTPKAWRIINYFFWNDLNFSKKK